MDRLADDITEKVIDTFNSLKLKSGKPVTRSNGVREWTVLGSIVAIMHDEIMPIAITTGVKALPDKTRIWSQGRVVHDMHAEVLAIRAFNHFLMGECHADSKFLERHETKYRLKEDIKLALYVSEAPCGDASLGHLRENASDSTPWTEEREGATVKRRKVEIVRGRAHFDREGIVRTKPGRSDSVETLSKSCSDKLCLKQLTGLNNSITSQIIEPIYLDYLVLKEDKFKPQDTDRCFRQRFPIGDTGKHISVLSYKEDRYPFHKDAESAPSPLSLVYLVPSKTVQVLNNGVKNGSYVRNKPPRKGGESFLCNFAMYQQSRDLVENKAKTYVEFKNSLIERNKLKQEGKRKLGNWTDTTKDDFILE